MQVRNIFCFSTTTFSQTRFFLTEKKCVTAWLASKPRYKIFYGLHSFLNWFLKSVFNCRYFNCHNPPFPHVGDTEQLMTNSYFLKKVWWRPLCVLHHEGYFKLVELSKLCLHHHIFNSYPFKILRGKIILEKLQKQSLPIVTYEFERRWRIYIS